MKSKSIVDNRGIYIPNLQSKDIIISSEYNNKYDIKSKNDKYKLKKFNYAYDWSKELVEIEKIYKSVYRNTKFDFSYLNDSKIYSLQMINVNFDYSVKNFNKICKNTYVKFGVDPASLIWNDCIAFFENKLAGVIVDTPIKKVNNNIYDIKSGIKKIKSLFSIDVQEDETVYKIDNSANSTIFSKKQIMLNLYTEGFQCDDIHYVRFMRAGGASRKGKCVFINEKLYDKIHKWDLMGIKTDNKVELAALETYLSLPASSSEDRIHIDPKSILIIPEYISIFTDRAVVTTKDSNDCLQTEISDVEIKNNIWDGQALISKDIMGRYDKFGMVLLRERYFKAACFSTNIQDFFTDNEITEIKQLHKDCITLATGISDIKLIITKSCCKYDKFGDIKDWLSKIDGDFYVVKTEHETKFYDNRMTQAHYQLWNTLQLDETECQEVMKDTFDYINLLNTDNDVFKKHISYVSEGDICDNALVNNQDKITMLMNVKDFDKTELFYNYKRQVIDNYYNNIKCGHSLISGCYAVLFGNPYSMLLQTIGKFEEKSEFTEKNTLMTTYYQTDEKIVGCRSPHVASGNLLLAKNCYVANIDKYFNLTDNIVCINSIDENTLERLSSADFDSDQMIITNEKIIVDATERNYDKWLVPTSKVEANHKKLDEYTPKNLAELDSKNANLTRLIGEVINFSQVLNSKIWHDLNNGKQIVDIMNIYIDACTLDTISCLCIDMAKKDFGELNLKNELNKIRKKYMNEEFDMTMTIDKNEMIAIPDFFKAIDKKKNLKKKNYRHYDTSFCYIVDAINVNKSKNNKPKFFTSFVDIFKCSDFDSSKVNYDQIKEIEEACKKANNMIKEEYLHYDEKRNKDKDDKIELYSEIRRIRETLFRFTDKKINKDTLYRLLKKTEEEESKDYRNLLFYSFINTENNSFCKFIKESQIKNSNIVEINKDEKSDLKIYGIGFKKVKS